MKIRIGNDFVFKWAITRGGLPEELTTITDAKLIASVFGKKEEIPKSHRQFSENIVTVEFTPDICNIIGSYNLELTYTLSDVTLSDADRKCAVDVDAFQIVARTAQADDPSEFTVTSDMAIAFRGKSAYEVWLETHEGELADYEDWLKNPATTAGAYAIEQGDYAKDQGDHAKTQGDYAKGKGDYAKEQGDYVLGLQVLNAVIYSETEYNEI